VLNSIIVLVFFTSYEIMNDISEKVCV